MHCGRDHNRGIQIVEIQPRRMGEVDRAEVGRDVGCSVAGAEAGTVGMGESGAASRTPRVKRRKDGSLILFNKLLDLPRRPHTAVPSKAFRVL